MLYLKLLAVYPRGTVLSFFVSMIPFFPRFKKIELNDKRSIERVVTKFPPYSDFNFTSLWSWNIGGEMKVARLNGNLVVQFSDYLSGEKYLSFIGNNKVLDTTFTLLHFSEKEYGKSYLKLIPEDLLLFYKFKNTPFSVRPDRDAADYIYLSEHLSQMNSWRKNSRGETLRNTLKRYPEYTVTVKTPRGVNKKEYHDIFHQWSNHRHKVTAYDLNEYKAFDRFLSLNSRKIKFISIYINKKLAGFTAYEILSNNYAIAHFSKANVADFPGIYDMLNWEEARVLNKLGVKFLNWEQDLGLEGLRYSKEKYKPYFLLKKLSIHLI